MTRDEVDAAVATAWQMPVPPVGVAGDREARRAYWRGAHARWAALADAYAALLPLERIGSGTYYAVISAGSEAEARRDHAAEQLSELAALVGVAS